MRKLFIAKPDPAAQISEDEDLEDFKEDPNKDMNAVCKVMSGRSRARILESNMALEWALPWYLEPGVSYHIFSFGDIDSISFLRALAREQKLEYLIASTWAMSSSAIREISLMADKGALGRMDFYVSDNFMSLRAAQYCELSDLVSPRGGRVAMIRNHSKVMVGFGDKYDFVVESSANMNTNYRSECTVITCDSGLARFYKEDVFDSLRSLNEDFNNWKPYILNRDKNI